MFTLKWSFITVHILDITSLHMLKPFTEEMLPKFNINAQIVTTFLFHKNQTYAMCSAIAHKRY